MVRFSPARWFLFLLVATLWLSVAAIGSPQRRGRVAKPVPPAPSTAMPSPEEIAEARNVEAVLRTDKGTIVLRFYPDDAPRHVVSFLKRAREGFYEGTTFFRVIRYGVIQGGDPLTKDPQARDRYGSGGLNLLKSEINSHNCTRGALAAVLAPGDPNSAGTQFFIVITDQPQLNGQYTVFGQVVSGMAAAEAISAIQADANGLATERVTIQKIEFRPLSRPAYRETPVDVLAKTKALISTDLGDILVEFFPGKAPEHVRRFLSFAKAGLYSGTDFHRIVPGFVIQGGAISGRQPQLDEIYNDWLTPLKAEFSDLQHERGMISMARGAEKDSAVDSFFICLAPQASLNGQYTAFARVTSGMDVVDRIAAVERGTDNETPTKRVTIKEIRVLDPTP